MSNTNEKLVYSIEETMQAIGIGRTKLYQELNSGRLKAVKVGKRTIVPKTSIENWLSNLSNY